MSEQETRAVHVQEISKKLPELLMNEGMNANIAKYMAGALVDIGFSIDDLSQCDYKATTRGSRILHKTVDNETSVFVYHDNAPEERGVIVINGKQFEQTEIHVHRNKAITRTNKSSVDNIPLVQLSSEPDYISIVEGAKARLDL